MSCAMLVIGDEVLRGETREANVAAFGEALARRGLALAEAAIVADEVDAIVGALRRLAGQHAVVLVSGGLGPTDDDLTRRALAEALAAPLARDAEVVAGLQARYAARGSQVGPLELRQADRPAGSALVANPAGTAPGFAARLGGCLVVALPGVPRELRAMLRAELDGWLRAAGLAAAAPREPLLRVFGASESAVAARLAELPGAAAIHVRSLPSFPELRLRLRPAGPPAGWDEAAWAAVDAFAARAGEALGWRLFARDDDASLASVVVAAAARAGATVAVAESCTGGRVLAALTAVPGASRAVRGGVVAYDNAVKVAALGVDPGALDAYGAVSEQVAAAMAEGARWRLGATVAVATSGVAGPAGGSADKPVGTLCLAVAGPGPTRAWRVALPGLDRQRFQELAAWTALSRLRQALTGPPSPQERLGQR